MYFKKLLRSDESFVQEIDEQIKQCVAEDFTTSDLIHALNCMKRGKSSGNSCYPIDIFKGDANCKLI